MVGAGAGGMAMGMPNMGPQFTPPTGAAARAPAAPRGPGGAYDLSERTVLGGKAAKDTACLAVELDGGKLTAAYSDDAGEKIRIVSNTSDGDRMAAVVGVPVPAAGVLIHWVDKRKPFERREGLPPGVTVGIAALDAARAKGGNQGQGSTDSPQLLAGLGRLLGRDFSDPAAVAHARASGLTPRARKVHARRLSLGILGYEDDDEVDREDGGGRVYEGSRVCAEIKAANRAGSAHVLPEEWLGLLLAELRARTVAKLKAAQDKGKHGPDPDSAGAAAQASCQGVSVVVPASFGDRERTACVKAAGMLGLDCRLVSAGLATLAGALVGPHAAALPDLGAKDASTQGGASSSSQQQQQQQGGGKGYGVSTMLAAKAEALAGKEEGPGAVRVLVVNGGDEFLEVSLVDLVPPNKRATDEGEGEGEGEGAKSPKGPKGEKGKEGPLAWLGELRVVCARGGAREGWGLADVLASLKTDKSAASDRLLPKVERAASQYDKNEVYSAKGLQAGVATDKECTAEAVAQTLEAAAGPVVAKLLQVADECLGSAAASGRAGGKGGGALFDAVLLRGPLFGALGPAVEAPLRRYLEGKLQGKEKGAGCGAKGVGVWVLPADSAPKGASALSAARASLPKALLGAGVEAREALQFALAVAHSPGAPDAASAKASGSGGGGGGDLTWARSEVVELFARDTPLPCVVSKTYDLKALKKHGLPGRTLTEGRRLSLITAEEQPALGKFVRLQPLGNPLVRARERDGEKERGVTVDVEFSLDASGLLDVRFHKFLSAKEDEAIKDESRPWLVRNAGRVLMLLVVLGAFGAWVFSAWGEYQAEALREANKHRARKAALEEFYRGVNPEKLGDIDRALEEHRGRETKLWAKLDKKYGRRPPRPDYLKYSTNREL